MGVMRLFKYNPSQGAPGEIEATFVARERVLEGIVKDLRARSRSNSNQHYLMIGPRGIGKTNLLLMIRCGSEGRGPRERLAARPDRRGG